METKTLIAGALVIALASSAVFKQVQAGNDASQLALKDTSSSQAASTQSPRHDESSESAVVVYEPKEILEKAEAAISQANTTINIVTAVAGLILAASIAIVGVFMSRLGRLDRRQSQSEKELSDLRTDHESLSKKTEDILTVTARSAGKAQEVSDRLVIGLLVRMDSKVERQIMERWIQLTEDEIGIDELEQVVNSEDMSHPFDYGVFAHLGHYYRYQAWYAGNTGLEHLYYRKALSYYRRAIRRAPTDVVKLSDLHANVGMCLYLLKDFRRSEDMIQRSINLRADNGYPVPSVLQESKGYVLMHVGAHEHAKESYDVAMATTENRPRLFYNMACNYALWADWLSGNGDPSKDKYQSALQLLNRIPVDTEFRERAIDDSDLDGLRKHSDFGQAFEDWTRGDDVPA